MGTMLLFDTKPHFYPRPPRGGRLSSTAPGNPMQQFLSTPSARRATTGPVATGAVLAFLSTPSARRATSASNNCFGMKKFLSTPSARRATARGRRKEARGIRISIHALREEGDWATWATSSPNTHFYPLPPRVGRLTPAAASTLRMDFYPRPPRGGRHPGCP